MKLFARAVVVLVVVLAVGCSSGSADSEFGATPTLRPYTPPFEDEVFESILISDITIEEMRELLGGGGDGGFSDRLPSLVVEPASLSIFVEDREATSTAINVSLEGSGPFEWDFMAPDVEWMSVSGSYEDEDHKIGEITVAIDLEGLEPGRYETQLSVIGLPVALDSPRTVPISLFVVAP